MRDPLDLPSDPYTEHREKVCVIRVVWRIVWRGSVGRGSVEG